jgi:hypothetical protein
MTGTKQQHADQDRRRQSRGKTGPRIAARQPNPVLNHEAGAPDDQVEPFRKE